MASTSLCPIPQIHTCNGCSATAARVSRARKWLQAQPTSTKPSMCQCRSLVATMCASSQLTFFRCCLPAWRPVLRTMSDVAAHPGRRSCQSCCDYFMLKALCSLFEFEVAYLAIVTMSLTCRMQCRKHPACHQRPCGLLSSRSLASQALSFTLAMACCRAQCPRVGASASRAMVCLGLALAVHCTLCWVRKHSLVPLVSYQALAWSNSMRCAALSACINLVLHLDGSAGDWDAHVSLHSDSCEQRFLCMLAAHHEDRTWFALLGRVAGLTHTLACRCCAISCRDPCSPQNVQGSSSMQPTLTPTLPF